MEEQRVPISHLRVGVFIRLELPWFKHPFLLGSFKIKSPDQIRVLKELGLSTVICIPEKSDQLPVAPSDLQPEAEKDAGRGRSESEASSQQALWDIKNERIARLKTQRERLNRCEREFEQTLTRVKNIITNVGMASREVVGDADTVVKDMVGSLLSDTSVVIQLMNTKPGSEDIFYHSLNAVVLGLVLGRECGLDADALQSLGLGLIFHDIGKQRIPKKILRKPAALTPPELKLIQLHPKYGEEMIASRVPDFPPEAMNIIGRHHETLDGKGYPSGLAGEQIPLLVRLASIANVFDNHCNKLDPAISLTPSQALSFMFRKQAAQLDRSLMAVFVRCLGVYPPGTLVHLSNDSVGMVVGANPQNTLRPSVLLYDPDIPRNEALIVDMEDEPDLTIVESIHPAKLDPQVFAYLSPRSRVSYFPQPAGDTGSARR
ncbi:MAG: HD-GYP domain-containing protein [Syntrophobacteraceae bacterium]